jgi:hypothetical protein
VQTAVVILLLLWHKIGDSFKLCGTTRSNCACVSPHLQIDGLALLCMVFSDSNTLGGET